MYEVGRGTETSHAKAHDWFGKAARQGNPFAQYKLGRIYERGQVVSKDLVEAYKWYLLSSQHGDKPAGQSLRRLETVLTPTQIDEAKRRAAAFTPVDP